MNENIAERYDTLGLEIENMCKRDQDARHKWGETRDDKDADAFSAIDLINTPRMKEIVQEIGWPTISKVGKARAHNAWLLVQHADRDVEFQTECLTLMKENEGDVDPTDVAYLEDRVRVNQGKPQLYGTQFTDEGSGYGPRPIEDAEHVDERRAALGLESMEEYAKNFY